ncbi:hypothetical protein [Pseudodesulfovibrio methanolicus]|uniref:Uncharacterized protein n=1 Tax=Pseudodesulfovibrio methanolicus TaxID=3126690 RepID=A0ABZ2IVB3_9BACT
MQLSTDPTTWPDTTAATRLLTRSRNISPVNGEAETMDESRTEGAPFTVPKELTPEEQQRVEFLQNLLSQTLAMAEGNPTDEQKTRIRDIENELEKITGVKMHSRISNMVAKMPGKTDRKKDREEDRERELGYQTVGIDPEEAVHNNKPLTGKGDNPGMQMLRRNALFNAISLEGLSSLASPVL